MAWHFTLTSPEVRSRAQAAVGEAPHGAKVSIREATRTLDQNARMWAMLRDVSKSCPAGRMHTPEQWKALFMHATGYEVQFLQGLNGEPFPAGFRSSKLSVRQMGDLMEFIASYGAEHGVEWSDDARAA